MFCAVPFTCLDVLHARYTTCCGDWLSREVQVFGPLADPWAVWNHPQVARLRTAILEGSFEFCRGCPRYLDHQLSDARTDECRPTMERGPRWLNFGNDPSCNLHCWSCRREAQAIDQADFRERVFQGLLEAFLPTCDGISLSHTGDPFASRMYREFLQSLDGSAYPRLKVRLFTNGLLLPRYWDSIAGIHAMISAIWISIDAATKETYELLRRGGCWDDLLEALRLASDFCTSRKAELQLNFCVQRANFREMPDFVRLAEDFGATRVWFGMLRRWWQTPEELAPEDLSDPKHPHHEELLRVLRDPALGHPIVASGLFREHVHANVHQQNLP